MPRQVNEDAVTEFGVRQSAEKHSTTDLRQRVMRALRWSAGAKLVGQLLTWAVTIIVIRLLEPKDYGLMAMATVFIGVMMMFNELGLSAALVQRPAIDRRILRQVLTLVLCANVVLAAAVFFGAPLAAMFFQEPSLIPVMQVLSLQFLISAYEAVPTAVMERELDLKRKSIVLLIAQLSSSAVTLTLAWRGFGVWSLVWGNLGGVLVRSVGSNIARPCPLVPALDLRGVNSLLSFGGTVAGERLLWFFSNRIDEFVVGRMLGTYMLGIYSVARHLSTLIMQKTGEILYAVSFPAFSSINKDMVLVSAYLLKAVRTMSFVSFPVFWGLSSVAPEVVSLLLGERWIQVGPIMQLLCLVVPLRMTANLLSPVLQGIGRPGRSLVNLAYAVVLLPVAFWVGSGWGLIGVGLAWIAVYPFVLLLMLRNALPLIGLGAGTFVAAMLPSLLCSGLMYTVVWVLRTVVPEAWPVSALLASLIAGGALAYGISAWIFNRETALEFVDLVRRR